MVEEEELPLYYSPTARAGSLACNAQVHTTVHYTLPAAHAMPWLPALHPAPLQHDGAGGKAEGSVARRGYRLVFACARDPTRPWTSELS